MRRPARLFLFAFVLFALLLVVAVVAVQAVLWSSLPQEKVVPIVERALGLEVRTAKLSTGWLGGTTLTDVEVSVPLEGKPFVAAPRIEVEHTGVLGLLFTRDFDLHKLRIEKPVLTVREMPGAAWNAQEAWDIIQQKLNRDDGKPSGRPPQLPVVEVVDATLRIERLGGASATFEGFTATATPRGQLEYVVNASAPMLGKADVSVALQKPYRHDAAFELAPDLAALRTLFGEEVPALAAAGVWRGEFKDGIVTGRLRLDRGEVDAQRVTGEADVRYETGPQKLRVQPDGMQLVVKHIDEPIRFVGGAAMFDWKEAVALEGLKVFGLGTEATLTGSLDPRQLTGDLAVGWRGDSRRLRTAHRGEVRVEATRGVTGNRRLRVTGVAGGDTPWGDVLADLSVDAAGESWLNLRGRADAQRLSVAQDGSRFHLDGLAAAWVFDWPRFTLERVALPESERPRTVAATGHYDFVANTWNAQLESTAFTLPASPVPIDRFTFQASGTLAEAVVESITVQRGVVQLSAAGAYRFGGERPLDLVVTLDKAPVSLGRDEESVRLTAENLTGRLVVTGQLAPLDVRADGDLLAIALRIGGDAVGDVSMLVESRLTDAEYRVTAAAPRWMGGRWRLDGAWDRARKRGQFDMVGERLELKAIDELLDLPVEVGGLGELRVAIRSPSRTAGGRFDAEGTFAVDALALTAYHAHVAAERVDGRLLLDDTKLLLREVRAKRGDAELTIDADVPLGGDGPTTSDLVMRDWPVVFDGGTASIALTGRGRVELPPEGQPFATASLATAWTVRDRPVGTLDIDGSVRPGRVEVRRIAGDVLGGSVSGQGVIDLETFIPTDFSLEAEGVSAAQLQPFINDLVELNGDVSGALVLEHAADPRALGPIRGTFTLDASDVSVQRIPLGQGFGVAYTDAKRLVLENLEIDAAGGKLKLWGRVTERPGGTGPDAATSARPPSEWIAFGSAALENGDLRIISTALDPEGRPIVGTLAGDLTLSAPLSDWRRAFGQGSLTVRDSDLVNIPLIATIYNLANLQPGATPDGRGRSEFRIENEAVFFPVFQFSSFGLDVHLIRLRVHDLWQGKRSPLSGYATWTQTLLPESTWLQSINEAIQNLQTDLTVNRVTGTVAEPAIEPVPFQTVRSVLGQAVGGR